MYSIGPYQLSNPTILAPMAGVTDLPFRRLCHRMGAGLVVGEMLTSDVSLWNSNKSRHRLRHDNEVTPKAIQIAGGDAEMLANAAQMTQQLGAQIIDINMGCPAKKVCKKAAGSASFCISRKSWYLPVCHSATPILTVTRTVCSLA